MEKNRSILLLICSIICILLLTACGTSKNTNSANTGKLVIAQSSDALYLDPHKQDEGPTNSVNCNIYDGLVNRKADLSIVPGLAEKWEQKDDLTWVFHLRKNVRFQNGNAFNADDVTFSLDRLSKEKVTGNILHSVASVKKIDDYTVEIKTKTPYAIFLADLAKAFIVDKEYVTQVGDEQFNLKPIGTGPYKVVEWIKEDHITLQANENYWGGVADIKTVIFRPISNEATRTAAFLSGEVQLIADVPVRDADRIAKNDKLQVIGIPGLRLIYLTMDVTRDKTPGIDLPTNPLKNEKVKQAVQMAIDKNSIVKNVMNGHAYVAKQGNPKQVAGYLDGLQDIAYNPEKAKQLLAEAGYPNGFTVTLDASNNRYPNDFKVAEAIASQLSKVGINVKLNLMPKSIFFNHIRSGQQTSLCLVGWSSDNADAGIWYGLMFYTRDKQKDHGGSNRCHYSNPNFDSVIDKANATGNMSERTKYLQEATKIVQKDVPFIPLYFQEDSYGTAKNIQFKPRLDSYIYAYDIHYNK